MRQHCSIMFTKTATVTERFMLVKIKQDTRELFADKVSLSHLSIKAVSDSNRR